MPRFVGIPLSNSPLQTQPSAPAPVQATARGPRFGGIPVNQQPESATILAPRSGEPAPLLPRSSPGGAAPAPLQTVLPKPEPSPPDGDLNFAQRALTPASPRGGPVPSLDSEPEPGALSRGLRRGFIEQNPRLYGEALDAIGQFSSSEMAIDLGRDLREFANSAASPPARVQGFRDIPGEGALDTVSRGLSFVGETVGEGISSTLPPIALGAAGTVLTGNPLVGLAVAATGASYPLNLGDVHSALKQELAEELADGEITQKEIAAAALLTAVPMAVLDIAGVGIIAKTFGKGAKAKLRRTLVRRVAIAVAKGAGGEGITEAVQEAISQFAQSVVGGSELFTRERVFDVIDSAIAGLLTGGAFGVAGGATSAVRPGAEDPTGLTMNRPPQAERPEPTLETPAALPPPRTREDLAADLADPRSIDEIEAERASQRATEALRVSQNETAARKRVRERNQLPEIDQPITVTDENGDVISGTLVDAQELAFDEEVIDQVLIRDDETGETLLFDANEIQVTKGDGTQDRPVQVETAVDLEVAATQVDPDPTEAQKEAENYKQGHVKVQGIDITIETAKGGVRRKLDENGQELFSVVLPAHYGKVKRTEGADGDAVDVYIGEQPDSQQVWIVDQIDPATGQFDEHKAMLGFPDIDTAMAAYVGAFDDGSGPSRVGGIVPMPIDGFKQWLKDGDTKSPLIFEPAPTVPREIQEPAPAAAPRPEPKPADVLSFLSSVGGIRDDEGHDLVRSRGARRFIPGVGPLIRPDGLSIDAAGEVLAEAGFFSQRPTEAEVLDLIDNALGGDRVVSEVDLDVEARRQDEEAAQVERERDTEAEDDVRSLLKDMGETINDEEIAVLAGEIRAGGLTADEVVVDFVERLAFEFEQEYAEQTGESLEPDQQAGADQTLPETSARPAPIDEDQGEGPARAAPVEEGRDVERPADEPTELAEFEFKRLTQFENEPSERVIDVIDPATDEVAVTVIFELGDDGTAKIESIDIPGAEGAEGFNRLGAQKVRRILAQIVRENPNIRRFTGNRAGGARRGGNFVPVQELKRAGERIATVQLPATEQEKQAPIVAFRKLADKIEETLPPAADGFTRLWRGNRPGEVGKNPGFTNDLPGIALPFQEAYGGPLSYVDAPNTLLDKFVSTGAAADGAEFRVSKDLARAAIVVSFPGLPGADPATEQTDQGTQTLVPGVEPVTDQDRVQVQADAPLRSSRPQRAPDDGIFDVAGRGQLDLVQQAAQLQQQEVTDAERGQTGQGVPPEARTRGVRPSTPDRGPVDAGRDTASRVPGEDAASRADRDTPAGADGLVPAVPTWAEFLSFLPKDADGFSDVGGRGVAIMESVSGLQRPAWQELTDDQQMAAVVEASGGAYEPTLVEPGNDGRRGFTSAPRGRARARPKAKAAPKLPAHIQAQLDARQKAVEPLPGVKIRTFGYDSTKMAVNLSGDELQTLRVRVEKNPDNVNPAYVAGDSIFILKKAARNKTQAIARAIQSQINDNRAAKAIKGKAPTKGTISFRRGGDFVNASGADADVTAAAKVLGVTLQKTRDGNATFGLPFNTEKQSLADLRAAGFGVDVEGKPATKSLAAAPSANPTTNPARAKKLRTAADRLQPQIDKDRNPATANQNPTRRRAAIIEQITGRADRLEEVQTVMRGLADIADGTHPVYKTPTDLPPSLVGVSNITSRRSVEILLHSRQLREPYVRQPRELIEKSKGLKGIAEARRRLQRLMKSTVGDDFLTMKKIEDVAAAEAIGKAVHKAGRLNNFEFKSLKDGLADGKILMNLGMTRSQQFTQAKEFLQGLLRPPTKEQKAEREIESLERSLIGTKIPGYFPTPKPLADDLVEKADIEADHAVLEPSAGKGNIADAIRRENPEVDLTVIETNLTLTKVLEAKGFTVAPDVNFLVHQGKYDRIVMNPPFEKGQDAEHVLYAFNLLKPGGRLVSIMGEGVFFRNDKKAKDFRTWLASVNGVEEKNTEGSFKSSERPTGVATRTVVIDKPGGDLAERNRPKSSDVEEALSTRPSLFNVELNKSFVAGEPVQTSKVVARSTAKPRPIVDLSVRPSIGQPSRPAPPFFSNAGKAISAAKFEKGTAEQYLALPGLKKEEIEFTGLDEFLRSKKGSVTRAEVQEFLDQNGVQLEETVKGAPAGDAFTIRQQDGEFVAVDGQGRVMGAGPTEDLARAQASDTASTVESPTKFGTPDLVLPGGENYRETLVLLPVPDAVTTRMSEIDRILLEPGGFTRPDTEELRSEFERLAGQASIFAGGHFDESRVLVHIRSNERTTADGSKTLFIEEIQSDWHQKGRRQGYDTPEKKAVRKSSGVGTPLVPDAPFKKTWHELGLKRAIRDAAERGLDSISWTTGAQQADRYNLSKQVDLIGWRVEGGARRVQITVKNGGVIRLELDENGNTRQDRQASMEINPEFVGKPLGELVGKEIAEKITAEDTGTLSGPGLRVGGQGMKTFYDKMLPQAANKIGKKFGARVGTTNLAGKDPDFFRSGDLRGAAQKRKSLATVHTFPITPALKREVLQNGLPLFSVFQQPRPTADTVDIGEPKILLDGLVNDNQVGIDETTLASAIIAFIAKIAPRANLQLVEDTSEVLYLPDGRTVKGQGRYTGARDLIRVALGGDDPMFVASHEVVHHLANIGVFTPKEWSLLNEEAGRIWLDEFNIESRYREYYDSVFKGNPEIIDPLMREEGTADAYATWRKDEKARKFDPAIVKIFRKIKNFWNRLRNFLRGKGFHTIDDIFSKVERGVVGKRRLKAEGVGARLPQGERQVLSKGDDAFIDRLSIEEAPTPGYATLYSLEPNTKRDGLFGRTFDHTSKSLRETLTQKNMVTVAGTSEIFKAGTDPIRVRLQDKFLPVKRVVQSIAKARGVKQLPDNIDTYLAEELMRGRTGQRLEEFRIAHVEPLIKSMEAIGISLEKLELYLYARHAPDRNKYIALINPEMPDGGSGMTDAEAAEIMSDLAPERIGLESLATRVDAINDARVAMLLDGNLIDRLTVGAWKEALGPHYVTLRGFDDDTGIEGPAVTGPRGAGVDVRGPESKPTFGRTSRAPDILAHTISMFEETIVRVEKNRVGNTLLAMVEANPNPDMWEVNRVKMKRVIDGTTGLVTQVWDRSAQKDDNVFATKIKGKVILVTIHHPGMARALKNLGVESTNLYIRTMMAFNRYLAFVNTSLSPAFILSNFSRDLITATINLTGFEIKKLRRNVIKDIPKALAGAYGGIKGRNVTEWQNHFNEFSSEGGKITFFGLIDIEAQRKQITKLLREASANPSSGQKFKRYTRALFRFIMDINATVENAVRLSAYKNLRDAGFSKKRAASAALNLTVNFTRKGELGTAINSHFLFSNASLQGSTRMFQAMHSKRVRKLVGGIILSSMGMAIMYGLMSAEDDDGIKLYEKISPWTRNNNIILMNPMAAVRQLLDLPQKDSDIVAGKIPMAYGYNWFKALGENIADVMLGTKSTMKAAADQITLALDTFNPLGSSPDILTTFIPTVAKPLVEIFVTNKNFAGSPISPEDNPFDPVPKPDSQRYWNSVGDVPRVIADTLNTMTGGNKARPGKIDWSPETLEYVYDFVTGAAGMFVQRSTDFVSKYWRGEDVEYRDVPIARRVIEGRNKFFDRSRYRDIRSAALLLEREHQTLIAEGKTDQAARTLKKHAIERAMVGTTRTPGTIKWGDKILTGLRKTRRSIEANRALTAKQRKVRLEQNDKQQQAVTTAVIRRHSDLKEKK